MVSTEQLVRGLMEYINREMIPRMPTTEKILMSAFSRMAAGKAQGISEEIKASPLFTMTGLVDDDGMIDLDSFADSLRQSMEEYGNMKLDLSLIGSVTLNPSDVEKMRGYISRA